MTAKEATLTLQPAYREAEQALQARRFGEVISSMTRLLQAHPQASEAFVYIARASLMTDDLAIAVKALKKALTLAPEDDYAHALYGYVLGETGEAAEAEEHFQAALLLNPQRALTHYWYADLLYSKLRRAEDSLPHAQKALALQQNDADFHVLAGEILANLGRAQEAETAFKQALTLDPDNALAHLNLDDEGEE